MTINKISKYLIIIFMISGLFGSLLFFPVHLSDGYTCFYHRIFDNDHPAMFHTQHIKMHDMNSADHELIDIYVHNYAWFWWGSLALIAFTIYRLKFFKTIQIDKSKKHNSGGS